MRGSQRRYHGVASGRSQSVEGSWIRQDLARNDSKNVQTKRWTGAIFSAEHRLVRVTASPRIARRAPTANVGCFPRWLAMSPKPKGTNGEHPPHATTYRSTIAIAVLPR